MKTDEILLESFDGFRLSVKYFTPDLPRPKAAVQVVHGMCEHKERYDYFAERLAERGFAVIVPDLRGHGASVWEDGTKGHFGDKNGLETLLKDQQIVNQWIREHFNGIPVYMFAHSMGSLIARNYIQQQDTSIERLILSGAPCYRTGCGIACALSKAAVAFSGAKGHNRLIKSFAPGGGNDAIPNAWLSYNQQNVEAYNHDPLCGVAFTNAGYLTLYQLDKQLHKTKNYAVKNPELDILFLAGRDDCVTGGEKGLRDSAESLKKAGYRHVTVKIYDHMRHEILNEDGRDRVIADAAAFFDGQQAEGARQ